MKALSIKQPWASAIVLGVKSVEIRTWKTNYRGPVLIHAPKEYDYQGEQALAAFMPLLKKHGILRGGIIGQAHLVMVRQFALPAEWFAEMKRHRCPAGWWRKGLYGWFFDKPESLSLMPCDGHLRLWDCDLVT